MAFQAAASADPPPGLPTSSTMEKEDMRQLFQFMQLQMQQQQARKQQVADLLKHMFTVQNTSLAASGGSASNATRSLDERQFRRISKFDNKSESWKEWRSPFMTAVRESSPLVAEVMETAEMSDIAITAGNVLLSNLDCR